MPQRSSHTCDDGTLCRSDRSESTEPCPTTPDGTTSRTNGSGPTDEERAAFEQDFALGELIYELRTDAGLSQRELAERMGTTQSVISRLEEGGGGRPRLDTLARVATALDRHLVVSFPDKAPKPLKDAVRVT